MHIDNIKPGQYITITHAGFEEHFGEKIERKSPFSGFPILVKAVSYPFIFGEVMSNQTFTTPINVREMEVTRLDSKYIRAWMKQRKTYLKRVEELEKKQMGQMSVFGLPPLGPMPPGASCE